MRVYVITYHEAAGCCARSKLPHAASGIERTHSLRDALALARETARRYRVTTYIDWNQAERWTVDARGEATRYANKETS